MMRPLFISEADVLALLPMSRAITLLRTAALRQAEGGDVNVPRSRTGTDAHVLHLLPARSEQLDRLGMKAYVTGRHAAQFWYFLFSSQLDAIIQADALGRIRTGAASAVATAQLARPDAHILAIIGAGNQAFTQIEAMLLVRPITEIRLFARRREAAEQLAELVKTRLGQTPFICATVAEAVATADIICTVTSAKEPILFGDMLKSGAHINAVGSNRASHREIDDTVVARAHTIVVEDVEQARLEAGDLVQARHFEWERVSRLCDYIREGFTPPAYADITLFESLGIGLWDLAVATDIAARFGAEQPVRENA